MTSVEAATAAFLKRAEKEGLIDVAYTTVDTPVGPLGVATTDAGLVKVALHPGEENFLDELSANVSPRILEQPAKLDDVRRQLDEYFNGRRTTFSLQIDWQLSHGFRQMVLKTLFSQVQFGEVVSYGELAKRVGHPKASRAVGTAMATNPVPIVVPCHRVLRTGGRARRLRRRPRDEAPAAHPRGLAAADLGGAEDHAAVVAAEAEAVRQARAGRPRAGLVEHEVDRRQRGIDGLRAVGRRDQPVRHRQHDRRRFERTGGTECVAGDALGRRDDRARACRTPWRSPRPRRRR